MKAFARMHYVHQHLSPARIVRAVSTLPLAMATGEFSKTRQAESSAAFSDFMNRAGPVAGVFFGRLTRRFGEKPSRRISGPSAVFISVNRLMVSLTQSASPLLAPMNNPYLRLRAVSAT